MLNQRQFAASALINVMTSAVKKAGRGLIRDFNEVEHLQVSRKGLGNFVSTADRRSEALLVQELQKARPRFRFLVEESGEIPGPDPDHRWIIDPLDGTTNFLHGIPHFAISVALEFHKQIIAAVVYNPITDEMYWAEKGKGAYVGNRRIRVAGRRFLDESLFGTGTPSAARGRHQQFTRLLERVIPATGGIRRFGAASLDLAFVAAGRLDGYFETGLCPWDVAAGSLLIQESGGHFCDFDGQQEVVESGDILAANPDLFQQVKAMLL